MADGQAKLRRATRASWSIWTSSAVQPVTRPGRGSAPVIVKGEQHSHFPYSAPHGCRRVEPRRVLRPRQDQEGPHDLPEFCHHLRSLYPLEIRFAIVWDNLSPLLDEKAHPGGRLGREQNVELAYVPGNARRLDELIEAQFQRCATSRSTAPTTHLHVESIR
jgi:hypothetical protein